MGRLRSPYHSNKHYAKKDLQSTNTLSFKRPIAELIIEQKNKKSQIDTKNALKSLAHLPPKYKVSGLAVADNANEACSVYQVLSPKHGKINYKKSKNEKSRRQIVHSSFDLDGDGVVGVKEFAIASFYDKDCDGKLNESEKANAMKAIRDGAIDKQYRFSAEGIHKYNKNEIASTNGGWFKHESDQTTQRLHGQTLSKLKAQRKQTKKDEATQIAQKYLTDKQNNKIKIDFPYAFADKHPNNEKSKELVIENPNKTRSQLLDRR